MTSEKYDVTEWSNETRIVPLDLPITETKTTHGEIAICRECRCMTRK